MYTCNMEFASAFVFARKEGEEEFDYISESRYNHKVTGFRSGGASSEGFQDDGEVHAMHRARYYRAQPCRRACWTYWTLQGRRNTRV